MAEINATTALLRFALDYVLRSQIVMRGWKRKLTDLGDNGVKGALILTVGIVLGANAPYLYRMVAMLLRHCGGM